MSAEWFRKDRLGREVQGTGLTHNGGEGPHLPVCPICFALMPERRPERHIQWHTDAKPQTQAPERSIILDSTGTVYRKGYDDPDDDDPDWRCMEHVEGCDCQPTPPVQLLWQP